jgi:hypothetical protein
VMLPNDAITIGVPIPPAAAAAGILVGSGGCRCWSAGPDGACRCGPGSWHCGLGSGWLCGPDRL